MTSALPEEDGSANRLKKKFQPHNVSEVLNQKRNGQVSVLGKSCGAGQDESRSFLEFSRENLSISTSELEQGFRKGRRERRCPSGPTLLGWAALVLALGCAVLVIFRLRQGDGLRRRVEELRTDVDTLKHALMENNLLQELRAFEEQLYSEGGSEEEPSSAGEYDSSYDEPTSSSTAAGSAGEDPRPAPPCAAPELDTMLAALSRRTERQRLLEAERERDRLRVAAQHSRERLHQSTPGSFSHPSELPPKK